MRLLLLFLLLCSSVRAEVTLQKLDEIFMKQGGIHNFLKNKNLQTEYYLALREYLRLSETDFPREVYDKILGQLRELRKNVPSIDVRVMEKKGLGEAFSIQAHEDTSQPPVDKTLWKSERERWVNELRKEAAHLIEVRDVNRATQAAEKMFESLLARIRKETDGKGKNARTTITAQIMEKAKTDPMYRQAAAFLTLQAMKQPDVWKSLQSEKSAELRETLKRLSSSNESGGFLPPLASSFIQDLQVQPRDINDFTVDPLLNPVSGRVDFIPVPRRFHGIWKGIALKECVGGNCNRLDDTTARRWATVFLEDTQLHFLEKEGKYEGFVQNVPIEKVGGREKLYGSVDFGSHLFSRAVLAGDKRQKRSFFEAWYDRYTETLSQRWRGLILSDADDIHNAGALPAVRESPYRRLAHSVGFGDDFKHHDPSLAGNIVQHSSPSSVEYEDMIFDAATDKDNEFYLLSRRHAKDLSGPTQLGQILRKSAKDEVPERLAQLLQIADPTPANERFLNRELGKLSADDMQEVKETLLESARIGVLTDNPLLLLFLDTPEKFLEVVGQKTDWEVEEGWLDRSRERSLRLFFRYPKWVDHLRAYLDTSNDADLGFTTRQMAASLAQYPEEFLRAIELEHEYEVAKSPYIEDVGELAVEFVDEFLRSRPSKEQRIAYLDAIQDAESAYRVLVVLLGAAQSQKEVDRLLKTNEKRFTPNEEGVEEIKATLGKRGFPHPGESGGWTGWLSWICRMPLSLAGANAK